MVYYLNASELNVSSLTTYNVDLLAKRDAIRSSYDATFDFTTDFKIKFQQYDNYASSTDGREWDNIVIDAILTPALSIVAGTEFLEGATNIPATLNVDIAPDADLVVSLAGDSFLSLPASVTILSGQNSADFTFSIVDDGAVQGDRSASITATATDHTSSIHNLTVHDDEITYTVTFVLGDNATLDSGDLVQTITWGQPAVEPVITVDPDWEFLGWDQSLSPIIANTTIDALYLPIHTVTFELGEHGTRIAGDLVQRVLAGSAVIPPGVSVENGWAFSGWNHSLNNISGDLTITATYVDAALAGILEYKLTASDAAATDSFGSSLSISGDTAVIGAYRNKDGGYDSGSAYIFTKQNGVWIEQAKLTASDAAGEDNFGQSVSISGDTVVIGAYYDDDMGRNSGSAYVFIRENGVWSEQAKLTASDGARSDYFGHSVCVSGDTAIIGAYSDYHEGIDGGSAYIFNRRNGVWLEQTKLIASDAANDDRFGYAVSISRDTAAVSTGGSNNAYVFRRSNDVWTEQAKLTASDSASGGGLGGSVSISDNTVIVRGLGGDGPVSNSGSAYVFHENDGVWSQQAKLIASDAATDDRFGCSVSISGDTAIVGAFTDDDAGISSGSAYVYRRSNGVWTEQAKLNASDAAADDRFGSSVGISGDVALVGAYADDDAGSFSGSTYAIDIAVPPATVIFDLAGKGIRTGGGELNQQIIVPGVAVEPLFNPLEGWHFTGWDVGFSLITEDLTVTAQYLPLHTVTFELDTIGQRIGGGGLTQNIVDGQRVIAPTIEVESGWIFDGWDHDLTSITEDTVITAQYLPGHTVSFDLGEHGSLAAGQLVQTVRDLGSAVPPDISVTDGWAFQGWDQSLNEISGDITITAQYLDAEIAGILEDKLTANDGASDDRYGSSVCISGDTAIIGAMRDDNTVSDSGSAYIYIRTDGIWAEQAKLTASDISTAEYFGNSVTISGDTAVIGAYYHVIGGYISGCAYVFTRTNGVWTEQAKLTASDAAADDLFGWCVSISGDTAIIGAYADDDAGENSGSAYVFTRSGDIWTEQAKLTASDAATDHYFGTSVSISGNTAIVGAPEDFIAGNDGGQAYVYTKTNGVWIEQAKLTASDTAPGDYFGRSVSISGDTAIIGAYRDDDAGGSSGSAYVFKRENGVWIEQAKLTASDAASIDFFGLSVSISGDSAVVGAYGNADAGSNSGSAYYYTRSNGVWTEQAKLTASDAASTDYFGYSVGISGNTAIIGAEQDDDLGPSSGSAYIYDLAVEPITITFDLDGKGQRTGGGELVQLIYTEGPAEEPIIAASEGWYFVGWDLDFSSVSKNLSVTAEYIPIHDVTFNLGEHGALLSGQLVQTVTDGHTAIPPEISVANGWAFAGWDESLNDVNSDKIITATYLEVDRAGTLETKLTAYDGTTGDSFGESVNISGDTAIVGAWGDDDAGNNSGSAYIFSKTNGAWTEQAKLTASNTSAEAYFGRSVSISGDTAIIGSAKGSDTNNNFGCAYVYTRRNGIWTEQAKLTASNAESGDYFGSSVSISGNTAIVGADYGSHTLSDIGSVYVYIRSNENWTEQAMLTASDAATYDAFGVSVSISGDTIIIGAFNDDDAGNSSGSAYIFVRNNGIWTEQAKLTASDAETGDLFGRSVSISGDTVIIGAVNGNGIVSESGSAYVFTRTNDVWTEQAKLTASNAGRGDAFGVSVSISGDKAIVGALTNDDAGGDSGSSYVFSRSNEVWTQQAKLTASDAEVGDLFGNSVSISGDTAIIGAIYGGTAGGSAYIYDLAVPPVDVTFSLADKALRTGGGELSQLVVVGTAANAPALTPNAGWVFDGWDTDFSKVITDLSINGLFSYDATDADGDNIPDGWEIVHLGAINNTDGAIDTDGDGQSDYDEFLAGSDPASRTDYFKVKQQEFSAQDRRITLSFNSNDDLANRRYRVLYSPDMSPGSWIEVPGSVTAPSSGNETQVTLDLPGEGALYFVRIDAFLE
ncbi:FG-GAP repeat protein [Cerasicoccus fimbriatus]|uniref:FG-GAP repeat protein n=1 Tax=Cerasicoccus fimbriatus TaxID=3014554 RepID=UPI0022B3B8D2|nr:FG-GAP repeat protein [Cerasicoccus sp. TK19100]